MYSPVLNTFPFCQKSSFPTCALIKHGKRLYEQWCCTLECWAVCRNEHSISPYSHRPGDKGLWSKPLPWPCLAQESSPHPCLFYLESYNIWGSCWNFLLRLMWLVEKLSSFLSSFQPSRMLREGHTGNWHARGKFRSRKDYQNQGSINPCLSWPTPTDCSALSKHTFVLGRAAETRGSWLWERTRSASVSLAEKLSLRTCWAGDSAAPSLPFCLQN